MADAQYFELCSLVIVRLVFALHGSVMNTMPPSRIREVRTEVLIDMMADLNLSCPRKNPGIITSTLAWSGSVPHIMSPWSLQNGRPQALIDNDRISPDHCYVRTVWLRDEHGTTMIVEGCVQEVAVHMTGPFHFFLRRGSTVYNNHTCAVSSGDDHHATMIFSSCRFHGLDCWYLEVFFVRSGCCRCYVWIVWYRDEHLSNGDRHDGSHPRVLSVTLPVIVAWLQSRSQCWTLLFFVLSRQVMNTVPPWSLRDALAQEVACHEYCCNWVVWSRDTYPQPWDLMDVDPRSLGCHDGRCVVFFGQLNTPPSSMREICSAWSRDD